MKEELSALAAGQAVWPFFLGMIAAAEAVAGSLQTADSLFDEARTAASKQRESWYNAELLRKQAEVRWHLSKDPKEVERQLQEAFNLARQQGAKLWGLRAGTSLAQIWRNIGRHDEACELFSLMHGTCNDNHEIADYFTSVGERIRCLICNIDRLNI